MRLIFLIFLILFPNLSFAEECKTLDGSVAKALSSRAFSLSRGGEKYIVTMDGKETKIPSGFSDAITEYFRPYITLQSKSGWRLYDLNFKPMSSFYTYVPMGSLYGKKYLRYDYTVMETFSTKYTDYCGKLILPQKNIEYSGLDDIFSYLEDDKWGLIDVNNKVLLKPKYSNEIRFFKFGQNYLAIVNIKNKYGIINDKGEVILPLEYDNIKIYSGNKFINARKKDKYYLLDENLKPKFGDSDKLIIYNQKVDKFYYIERVKINNNLNDYERYNNIYNLIDDSGNTVKEKVFSSRDLSLGNYSLDIEVWLMFNDFGLFKTVQGSYLDYKGDIIIPPDYQDIGNFNHIGVAPYKQNDKWGLLDAKNNKITEAKYDLIAKDFIYGIDFFRFKKDGKWGALNSSGKEIISAKFDYLNNLNVYALFTKNGKVGVVDENGKIIINPIYDNIDFCGGNAEYC